MVWVDSQPVVKCANGLSLYVLKAPENEERPGSERDPAVVG